MEAVEDDETEPEGDLEGTSREARGDADGEADPLVVALLQGQGLALKLAVGEKMVLGVTLPIRENDALPE